MTNKLPLLLTSIGMVLMTTPIFSIKGNDSSYNDGGVFISEVSDEEGPMFYAADYSSSITDEPSYISQKQYTFDSMNFNETYKHYRGESVKVAVIDSGINYTHEDFQLNSSTIVQGHSRTIDNTSGSWLYYQFSSGYQTKLNDTLGHGTNVASVIASQINAIGCAGIAPNVELYVYKVTNTDNGYAWYAIQSALQYCIDEGIDVINMSFQSYEHAVSYNSSTMGASSGCSTVLSTYLNNCYNAGITLVAAAGNYNTSEPSYPASNNHVISVGSLAESSTDTKAGYSNTYGIDLVAPGTVYVADKGTNSSYKKTSGTSFSAPIVTAAIALYKQANPSATPAQIEAALKASCDPISGNPDWAGSGRLNIDNFLGISTPTITPSESEVDLTIGETHQLSWTVDGQGVISNDVEFELLMDDGTISVSDTGLITALAEGQDYVLIKSVDDDSIYGTIEVTVGPQIYTVDITDSAATIKKGSTKQLSATVSPTGPTVSWTSSNNSIATVDSSGLVTATGVGNATITASINGGEYSDTCTVTVIKADLVSIATSGEVKTTYYTSDSFIKPTIIATYADGTSSSDIKNSCQFTGYNMNNAGNQTVTVSYTQTENGRSINRTCSYNITVIQKSIESLVITTQPTKLTYTAGDTFDPTGMVVKVTYNNGDTNNNFTGYTISKTTALSTSDTSITISYTFGGQTRSATVNITVNAAPSYVLVNDVSQLSNGDKVVVKLEDGNGVTGWNNNKDATISTTSSSWVEFTVAMVTGGFTLYDSGASKYIASPTGNEFKYSTSGGVCSVDSDGHLVCNSRYLCQNGTVYRFYTSIGSYTPFFVYMITSGATVSSVTVNPSELNLDLNGSTSGQLSATVNAYNDAPTTITWSSSDETVATVSNSGYVTAHKVGDATITATSTFDSNKSGSATVHVDDSTPILVNTLTLNKTNVEVQHGNSTTLTATVNSDATNKTLSWVSSQPSAVSLSSSSGSTVTITANGASGVKATITVSTTDGSNLSTSCSVTITDRATLESIEFVSNSYTNSVIFYDEYNIGNPQVTAHFSDGNSTNVTASATITNNIDTTVLGPQYIEAEYTYEGVTKSTRGLVNVTNNGAGKNVGDSYEDYVPATVTYTFTSASWGDSTNGWNCNQAGNQYSDGNQGIQITSSSPYKNAGATSKKNYANVTSVVINYCTNSSKGAGTVSVQVGSNSAVSKSVTSTGGTTLRNLPTYEFEDVQTGAITILCNCTTNSIYIHSITINYEEIDSVSYPASFNDQAKAWSTYFLNTVKPDCDNNGVNSNISSIQSHWTNLANEYGYMESDSKNEFKSSSDIVISEARELYSILMSKYKTQLNNDFAVDGDGHQIVNVSRVSILGSSNNLNTILLVVITSMLASVSIVSFLYLKRKKER